MNRRDIGVVVAGLVLGSVTGLLVFNPGNTVQQIDAGLEAHVTGPIDEYLKGALEAHYSFDGDDAFAAQYDRSILPDGISRHTGVDGQGLRFNRSARPLTLRPDDVNSNGSMSAMLWVKAGAEASQNITPEDYPILFQQGLYDAPQNFVLQGGLKGAGGAFIAGRAPETGLAVPLLDAGWHHMAASFDGETMRFYVDGELAGRRVTGAQNRFAGLTGPWSLGSREFQGVIDEVRIYDQVIDAEQVRSAYETHAIDD